MQHLVFHPDFHFHHYQFYLLLLPLSLFPTLCTPFLSRNSLVTDSKVLPLLTVPLYHPGSPLH